MEFVKDNKEPKHGVGDRKEYYSKWDKLANEIDTQLSAEEQEIKKKLEEEAAKVPQSEADRRDREKREELKAAKKQWDSVKAEEEAKTTIIEKESHEEKELDGSILQNRRVVVLKDNANCKYTLPVIPLTKVFIEGCNDCHFIFHAKLATSTVEVTRCNNITISVVSNAIHTMQLDMSSEVTVRYSYQLFTTDTKVYHSSVSNLRIEYDHMGSGDGVYQILDDHDLAKLNEHINVDSNGHQQFVTTYRDNDLVTDLVLRDRSGHPITMRELEERRQMIERAAREKGLDINDEAVQKALHEYDPPSATDLSTKHKEEGNKAFKACDYAQAAVHYTQAIEVLVNASDTASREVLCTIYSNRAACSLKLGDHTNALNDANASLAINDNHVKSNFRKGLALHALGRYREACPVLGKALKMEPNNKQIASALTFAERKAMMTPAY